MTLRAFVFLPPLLAGVALAVGCGVAATARWLEGTAKGLQRVVISE